MRLTQQQFMVWAREAGLWPAASDTLPSELEHFAKLVAAAERKECEKICNEQALLGNVGATYCASDIRMRDGIWDPLSIKEFCLSFARRVAAAEREACAIVAEDGLIGHTIAKAIRARREQ